MCQKDKEFMRKMKCLIAVGIFFIGMILVACTNKNIDVSGTMSIQEYTSSLKIDSSYQDPSEQLTRELVKISVQLSTDGEDVEKKDVTIDLEKMEGATVEFTSLDVGTEYTVELIAYYDGAHKKLDAQTVSTLSHGETEEDPIEIHTATDLKNMDRDPDAYYKLMADIDFQSESLSAIFNTSNPFLGHFDGNGKSISNVLLGSESTYSGIFGVISGEGKSESKQATVKNLKLKNITYDAERSNRYLGALAGKIENCAVESVTVENVRFTCRCWSSSTIMVGALAGWAVNSTINHIIVKGIELELPVARFHVYVGGLIGSCEEVSIGNSSVEGTISAQITHTSVNDGYAYIGGFVGVNDSVKPMKNCYAKCDITVTEDSVYSGYRSYTSCVGGFVGRNWRNNCNIDGCAAIGQMDITLSFAYTVYVGGFYGDLIFGSVLKNCFYVPTKEGLKVRLMSAEVSDDEKEEGITKQTAFVGLTVGYCDEYSILDHVFAYQSLWSVVPEGSDQNHITVAASAISSDLSILSEFVRSAIV